MKQFIILLVFISLMIVGCSSPTQEIIEEPPVDEPSEPVQESDPPEVVDFEESDNNEVDNSEEPVEEQPQEEPEPPVEEEKEESVWRDTAFTDVATGETFTINQFDKPVILESFAVWCPKCTRQQQNIKALHEEIGDEVVSIALDTDPNEDKALVQKHIDQHGFDWYYAISPVDATQSLIDEFGLDIVNAPSTPVVLICPDDSVEFLGRGIKSVDDLKTAIGGCSSA